MAKQTKWKERKGSKQETELLHVILASVNRWCDSGGANMKTWVNAKRRQKLSEVIISDDPYLKTCGHSWVIIRCGLYKYKMDFLLKIRGCGLCSGALCSPEFTVSGNFAASEMFPYLSLPQVFKKLWSRSSNVFVWSLHRYCLTKLSGLWNSSCTTLWKSK